ncbi:MAG: DUF4256 domain-containing protein [Saprospiraceae bacterium]|nr:DUF4256 domain-containing protein [Saprospiraceae bacterium]MDW8482702.1 DUF4256 domain-containing protein [Saprospiraceae bacterium]
MEYFSFEMRAALMQTLQQRFEQYPQRHCRVKWAEVVIRLLEQPEKMRAIYAMERTGGEPDVVDWEAPGGSYLFVDCSLESPSGRRNLCYDRAGQLARKDASAAGNAVDFAASMGIDLLTEEEYRRLQAMGPFDMKTSSWLKTPPEMRSLGGALFGDFRYGRVFIYHNGAQAYYASRGFRGKVVL